MSFILRAATEADVAELIRIRNMPGVRWGTLAMPYESVHLRGGMRVYTCVAGNSQPR